MMNHIDCNGWELPGSPDSGQRPGHWAAKAMRTIWAGFLWVCFG